MSTILQRCAGFPSLTLSEGDVLMTEGEGGQELYVVVDGAFSVSRDGVVVASVAEVGAVLGEVAILLDGPHSATVTAVRTSSVYVVEDPLAFLAADGETIVEIARTLARRLDRLSVYLADVKAQYGDQSGHLGLLDDVLAELAYGDHPQVESGSERDPDPYY